MKKQNEEKLQELLQDLAAKHGYKSIKDVKDSNLYREIYDEAQMRLQSFRNYQNQKHQKKQR